MKLKYYLRGLGIGIVVTAIIMTVALGNKQPMTDEEVIARAKELGMIENTVLTDIGVKDTETADQTEEQNQEQNEEKSEDKESEDVTKHEDNLDTDKEKESEDTTESDAEDEESTAQKDVMPITVVSGDSSWTVAKRMEEAGLIDSAKDFDAHLCRYGYDKKISVGTYNIPITATHEEMAKILTKSD